MSQHSHRVASPDPCVIDRNIPDRAKVFCIAAPKLSRGKIIE
jgi:hypothetical protein